MNSEWKMVPVEPTDDMQNAARDWSIKRFGIGVGYDESRGCYAAMLAAAPVPPAGGEPAMMVGDKRNPFPNPAIADGYASGWNNRNSEVTRLTAERDGLLAEVESYKQGFWGRMAARNQIALRKSDAELTKARELLNDMLKDDDMPALWFARRINEILDYQSAPAAEGE